MKSILFCAVCIIALGASSAASVSEAVEAPEVTALRSQHATGQQYVSINTWVSDEQYKVLQTTGIDLDESNKKMAANSIAAAYEYPTVLKRSAQTLHALEAVDKASLISTLTTLSNFNTRHHRSPTGVDSADWIFARVSAIIADSNSNIELSKFSHAGWAQYSIIARFVGSNSSLPRVIVGAHQDSIVGSNIANRSPGADDDGSGTVTLLELLRVLVAEDFSPARSVEFHWYSAEETGLLGSKAISASYKNSGVQVYAMLNFDMDGYTVLQNVFGVITDYVDASLTQFMRVLVETYSNIPWVNTRCNYACSDHAPWSSAGYPAAFLFEAEFNKDNPYIHSAQDTIDRVDFDHVVEFVKVGLAFFYEVQP